MGQFYYGMVGNPKLNISAVFKTLHITSYFFQQIAVKCRCHIIDFICGCFVYTSVLLFLVTRERN